MARRGLARGAEGLSVGLKRSVLSGPPVEQCRIVLERQQRSGNLLCFWHALLRRVKAGFFVSAFRVVDVSQPSDISIAHVESGCADIHVVTVTHLRGAGEGNDTKQQRVRTILQGGGQPVGSVVKAVADPLQDRDALLHEVGILLVGYAEFFADYGSTLPTVEDESPHNQNEEGNHR